MKRQIKAPVKQDNKIESIVEHLIENGFSEFGANQFIHINVPALNDRSILRAVTEGDYLDAWGFVESYLVGDYF